MKTATLSVGQRLDNLPPGRFHVRILCLIGAGMFFDGFDIYLGAGVLGALVRDGMSNVSGNSWFISATFAGMTVGAAMAGVLGDRYGRRFSYQFNLAIFGIASLAAAFAPTMGWLTLCRLFMGIGLGAEIVVGYGTISEFMPPRIRGKYALLLAVFTNSALLVATFGGFLIIPYLGWRWMFAIAGIGAGAVWLMRKNMPESPRWLESKGHFAEADRIVNHIENDILSMPTRAARRDIAADLAAREAALPVVPIGALFRGKMLSRTITGLVINVVNNLITHGFITWMPTFFIAEGLTVTRSLGFTAVMTAGAPLGAFVGYLLAENLGRKRGVVLFSFVALVLGLLYPYAVSPLAVMGLGFCLVMAIFITGTLSVASYVPELFPTAIRMRGVGLCSTVGRLANVGIPFAVAFLYVHAGIAGVLGFISAGLAVQGLVVAFMGVETKGLSLETVAGDLTLEPSPSAAAVGDAVV